VVGRPRIDGMPSGKKSPHLLNYFVRVTDGSQNKTINEK
jgi:hypothetical protein